MKNKWISVAYLLALLALGGWGLADRDWVGVGINFGIATIVAVLIWWRHFRKGPASVSVTVTLDKDPVPKGEFFTYDKITSETPLKQTAPPRFDQGKYESYDRFQQSPAYQTWLAQHKEEYPDCSLCPLPSDQL